MSKVKYFITGLIAGVLIATATLGFAATSKTFKGANFNNYKAVVNGKEVATDYPFLYVQTQEDKYQKTFGPIRPIVEAMGATLTVDDESETYNITTPNYTPVSVSKTTPDGIEIETIDGGEYVSTLEIRSRYFVYSEESYYIDIQPVKDGTLKFYSYTPTKYGDGEKTIIINSMPVKEVKSSIRVNPSSYYISYEYYINTILPLIKTEPLY